MEKITLKRVYDEDGLFEYLELHQNNNTIKLSLANTTLGSGKHSHRWDNLKELIDEHGKFINEETRRALSED